jgi:mono/diheme cytochrome c family protein
MKSQKLCLRGASARFVRQRKVECARLQKHILACFDWISTPTVVWLAKVQVLHSSRTNFKCQQLCSGSMLEPLTIFCKTGNGGISMGLSKHLIRTQLVTGIALLGTFSAPALLAGDAARGNELFQQYCVGCHGPDGRGGRKDGFMPRPQNLTKKGYIDQLPDEYLFTVITKGGEGVNKSAYMPSFGKKFSSEDVENVIAFIRSLALY